MKLKFSSTSSGCKNIPNTECKYISVPATLIFANSGVNQAKVNEAKDMDVNVVTKMFAKDVKS